MRKPLQLVALLLILLCGYTAHLAYQFGTADEFAAEARSVLRTLQRTGQFDPVQLDRGIEFNELAVQRAPDHAGYRAQLAQLLTIKFLLVRDKGIATDALDHIDHGLQISPRSIDNWVAMAELKHYLNEPDSELSEAILQATTHGPWEARVLQGITRAGVPHFQDLSQQAQVALMRNISRGFRSPIEGVPDRMPIIIREASSEWTLEFTKQLKHMLVTDEWLPHVAHVFAQQAFMIWPLLDTHERRVVVTRTAAALTERSDRRIIMLLRQSQNLSMICPYLPRKRRLQKLCSNRNLKL